jgi:hypothetical protein
MPISAALCASTSGSGERIAIDVPGNPLNRWPRSHSAAVSAIASAMSRVGPRVQSMRASARAETGVAGHAGRQRDDRERQQPAEGFDVDQKCVTDPIESGEKIAEAEPPAAIAALGRPPRRPPAAPSTSTPKSEREEQQPATRRTAPAPAPTPRPRRTPPAPAASPSSARSSAPRRVIENPGRRVSVIVKFFASRLSGHDFCGALESVGGLAGVFSRRRRCQPRLAVVSGEL